VETYIAEAQRLGLKLGVASSSPLDWVEGHLTRLGLVDHFEAIRSADDVPRTKPDPALYVTALDALGVRAEEAIALEDSPHGVTAANRAGIYCVAVPNALTGRLSLDHADRVLSSLADLPLEALLSEVSEDGR
jgi:beta-phosphoglucomutase-like phosphatase (HAD superfamily)